MIYFRKSGPKPKFEFIVCLIYEHIHTDVIKKQTTRHKTARIVVTYVILLYRDNMIFIRFFCFFDEDNSSLSNNVTPPYPLTFIGKII